MSSQAASKRPRRAVLPALTVQIHQYLRERKIPSGTHLTAQEMSMMFGVSRWTVSKALERLAEKGVVTHKKASGYYVADGIGDCPPEEADNATKDLNAIYYRMAEERLNGNLPDQVTEAYLRQRFDVTAAELSSLLHRIVKEGWIERRSGYGWKFSDVLMTPQALEQIYRLRLAIEPAALREPGFYMEPAVIAHLRALNEEILNGGARTLAPDALYERGVTFHEAIAKASRNPFFLDALRRINSVRRLLIYRSMARRDRFYGQARGHLEILALIEKGDLAAAANMLQAHLEAAIAKVPPEAALHPAPRPD